VRRRTGRRTGRVPPPCAGRLRRDRAWPVRHGPEARRRPRHLRLPARHPRDDCWSVRQMSATTRNQVFTAVHTVRGLLPADMLVRISEGRPTRNLKGIAPSDYRIPGSRSVRDEAERHWDNLKSLWRELRDKLPAEPESSVRPDSTGYARVNWVEPLFE